MITKTKVTRHKVFGVTIVKSVSSEEITRGGQATNAHEIFKATFGVDPIATDRILRDAERLKHLMQVEREGLSADRPNSV